MKGYSLKLYTGVLPGPVFVADITEMAAGWTRSIRAVGGPWQGSFQLTADLATLQQFFNENLGFDVEEAVSNVRTWQGLIYEMELSYQGVRRRRSLALLANAVKARYTDTADNTAKETAFSTDANSITRYGRKEEAVTLGTLTTASATARRDTGLKENAWPWARPVSAAPVSGPAVLDVRVCGYAFTMNFKFTSVQDGATGNLSTYINDIIVADCQFVSVGAIRTNTLQVKRATALAARAWDALSRLVAMGDASGNPWKLYVDIGRRLNYEQIVVTPAYYLRQGGLFKSLGERVTVSPWLVVPAVIRDAQYPVTRAEPGAWLSDVRDIFAEEVSVDADGKLSFTTSLFSEAAILDAQQQP